MSIEWICEGCHASNREGETACWLCALPLGETRYISAAHAEATMTIAADAFDDALFGDAKTFSDAELIKLYKATCETAGRLLETADRIKETILERLNAFIASAS